MAKDIYNAAVIGCGWIGEGKHVPGIMANPDLRLTALCDAVPERAERLKKMHGADCKVYSDYRELLKDESIDMVFIAVPNPLHCELTVAALEAGKHVLVEKPMAMNAAECDKMIAAAKKAKRKLTVGYQWRYRTSSLYVKELCRSGELGDIYYAKAHAARYRAVPAWGEYLSGKNGGGVLIDGAPHALDLTLWAMDNYKPKSVRAVTMRKLADQPEASIWGPWREEDFKVEDTGLAFITMENGAVIFLEAAWAMNMLARDMTTTLVGTRAGIDMLGNKEGGVRVNGVKLGHGYITEPDLAAPGAPFAVMPVDPMLREAIEFVKAVREDCEPFVKPEEARVVSQIIDGIYTSAAKGQEIFF